MTILPSYGILSKDKMWYNPHTKAWTKTPIFAWTTANAATRATPKDEKGKNATAQRYIPGKHYLPQTTGKTE